jgi:hypothetical protein
MPGPKPGQRVRNCVAAVVHRVVDEHGMPAQRNPPARRLEIGLRRDRILLIAELIAHIGEKLDKGDAEIGDARLLPLRRELRHPVKHQAAEALVVLGEIIDVGRDRLLRRADVHWLAIEIRRAFDLEGEIDRVELRVEVLRRVGIGCRTCQRQCVGRIVSGFCDADHEHGARVGHRTHDVGRVGLAWLRQLARQRRGRPSPLDGDVLHPLAAGDYDVAARKSGDRPQAIDE